MIELKGTVEPWQKHTLVLLVFYILNTWAVYSKNQKALFHCLMVHTQVGIEITEKSLLRCQLVKAATTNWFHCQ